jgi:hypothetical protein
MGGSKASKSLPATGSSSKTWTVLVYMAGDNNLTEEMTWGLQEMRKACAKPGVADKMNLVVQFDPRGSHPRRYDIVAGGKRPRANAGATDGALGRHCTLVYDRAKTDEIVQRHIARECLRTLPLSAQDEESLTKQLADKLAGAPRETATRLVETVLRGVATTEQRKAIASDLATRLEHGSGLSSTQETSAALVQSFVSDQIETLAPAANYMAVLSGHGSGAVGDFLPDSHPRSSLSIPQLGRMLRMARSTYGQTRGNKPRLAILGMDTCLMSMIEVAYEVSDSVEYLVGSEGFVQNAGWPYHRIVEAVAAHSDPKAVARAIVDRYLAFYRDYEVAGVSTDMSACDLQRIGQPPEKLPKKLPTTANLATATKFLAERLREALASLGPFEELEELRSSTARPGRKSSQTGSKAVDRSIRDAVVMAHWYAQSYKREQYVDLYDFCEQLERFCGSSNKRCAEIQTICRRIRHVIEHRANPVVVRSSYTGADFQHSHGLSVYFPWAARDYVPAYRNLKFAWETGWADFLETYLLRTLRVRRNQEAHRRDRPMYFGRRPAMEFLLSGDPEADAFRDPETGPVRDPETGPFRDPETGPVRDPETGPVRDPETGPVRDPETGPRRFGSKEQSGYMKNPPDGFYRPQPKR